MPRKNYQSLTVPDRLMEKLDELVDPQVSDRRKRNKVLSHALEKLRNSINEKNDPMIIPSKILNSAEKSPKKTSSKTYVGGVFDD